MIHTFRAGDLGTNHPSVTEWHRSLPVKDRGGGVREVNVEVETGRVLSALIYKVHKGTISTRLGRAVTTDVPLVVTKRWPPFPISDNVRERLLNGTYAHCRRT